MDKNKIYLAQTDTTVGFLSSDALKLSLLKKRNPNQKILQVVDSFATLKKNTRIPNKHKNRVRRSKATTYIYPKGFAFRVVGKDLKHYRFIQKFEMMYSTSANETSKSFDFDFGYEGADIIVFSDNDFYETSGSKILKITNTHRTKIR